MEEIKVHKCKHYNKNCIFVLQCCKKKYSCKWCHDENESHHFKRSSLNQIECILCNKIQEISDFCIGCGHNFAKYFCKLCCIWSDNKMFHCEKCRKCKLGERNDYFHCNKCNTCMDFALKDKHLHIENVLEGDCPICAEYLSHSTREILQLECGHAIHTECYDYYLIQSIQCPICKVTSGDFLEYNNKVDMILQRVDDDLKNNSYLTCLIDCLDCKNKSRVTHRFMFNKCEHCKSYNTNVDEIYRN